MQRAGYARAVVAVAVLAGSLASAQAQEWPSQPIRLMVGFGPGGGTDVVARIVA